MIIVLIILICIVLITGYIAGNFLFELALDPKASKAAIFSNDDFEAAIKAIYDIFVGTRL